VKYGSEADPGTSPTAAGLVRGWVVPERPEKKTTDSGRQTTDE